MTSFVDNSNQEYDHARIPGMIFLQDIVNDHQVPSVKLDKLNIFPLIEKPF